MKNEINNRRTVKSIDGFSTEDLLSILSGEGDPTGPIIIWPSPTND